MPTCRHPVRTLAATATSTRTNRTHTHTNTHPSAAPAQVIDSGQVRRGTYWDDPTFQAVIQQERQRIKDSRNKPKQ